MNLKQSHAGLHQSAVDANGAANRTISELAGKVEKLEMKVPEIPGAMSTKKLSLIEPKQVAVEEFSGGVSDARNKFIEWSERVRDRVKLYDPMLADAMKAVERTNVVIDQKANDDKGISAQSNRELQGFIKDRTAGIAGAIVRSNHAGIGLESWRLLWAEFSP